MIKYYLIQIISRLHLLEHDIIFTGAVGTSTAASLINPAILRIEKLLAVLESGYMDQSILEEVRSTLDGLYAVISSADYLLAGALMDIRKYSEILEDFLKNPRSIDAIDVFSDKFGTTTVNIQYDKKSTEHSRHRGKHRYRGKKPRSTPTTVTNARP